MGKNHEFSIPVGWKKGRSENFLKFTRFEKNVPGAGFFPSTDMVSKYQCPNYLYYSF